MKNTLKKAIALLAVLAMVFALTACGGKKENKTVYRTLDEIEKSGV